MRAKQEANKVEEQNRQRIEEMKLQLLDPAVPQEVKDKIKRIFRAIHVEVNGQMKGAPDEKA